MSHAIQNTQSHKYTNRFPFTYIWLSFLFCASILHHWVASHDSWKTVWKICSTSNPNLLFLSDTYVIRLKCHTFCCCYEIQEQKNTSYTNIFLFKEWHASLLALSIFYIPHKTHWIFSLCIISSSWWYFLYAFILYANKWIAQFCHTHTYVYGKETTASRIKDDSNLFEWGKNEHSSYLLTNWKEWRKKNWRTKTKTKVASYWRR